MVARSGDIVVVTKELKNVNAKLLPGDTIELIKSRGNLDGVETWIGWLERHGFKMIVSIPSTHFGSKSEGIESTQ
jgi:hypothetical protein